LNIFCINLNYIFYLECWDGEPDNRPTIYQVVDWLKVMTTKTAKTDIKNENLKLSDKQEFNEDHLSPNNLEPQGDLSQLIQNFDKMNTKEIDSMVISNKQENLSTEKDFNIIVDEINDFIIKLSNKGNTLNSVREQVIECFNNYNTSLQEIYNWLLNNQNSSNSIFLLGYFYYFGIETNKDYKKAFNLFIRASEENHILAQYFIAFCYKNGYGTEKNEKLAFEYFEKVANKNYAMGQLEIGICYKYESGINKDLNMAFYWYEKAANNGNIIATQNLGNYYKDGIGVKKDYNKAFKLYKQSAEGGYSGGIMALGYCYSNGIGTKIDEQKAFELYQSAANLGDDAAQNNLAIMYERGDGITKDIGKAIYWYKKSAEQGNESARNSLKSLQKNQ
jgi:TPR repeat protein